MNKEVLLLSKAPLPQTTQDNLLELASYLKKFAKTSAKAGCFKSVKAIPVAFDIHSFHEDDDHIEDHECHTSACAVGHFALMRGYKVNNYGVYMGEQGMESWRWFSTNVVGIAPYGVHERAWDWMFGGSWMECDNTPLGVVARIDYFLEYGVPDNFIIDDCGNIIESASAMAHYLPIRERLEAECAAV